MGREVEGPVKGQRVRGQACEVQLPDGAGRILPFVPQVVQRLSRRLRLPVFVPIALLKKVPIRLPHSSRSMARDAQYLRVADIQQSCWVPRRVRLQRVPVSGQTCLTKPQDAVCHRWLPPGKADAPRACVGPKLGYLFEYGDLCWHVREPVGRGTRRAGLSTVAGALVFQFV